MPDKHAIGMYLRESGYDTPTVIHWDNLPSPTLNDLIEFMGRLCYASFDTSRNENLTRVRSDQAKYLWNILESGHGSVLEHAQVNFVIRNCSRVVTHELVRHRVGVAISQESMRYVRLDDWDFVYPEAFNDTDLTPAVRAELLKESAMINGFIQSHVNYMTSLLHLDEMNFDKKKRYTSALRKWLPHGVATQMGWSANIRTLRHVISMRTDDAAEEEMRAVADGIARICFDRYPMLFADFEYSAPTNVLDAPVWKAKFHA
jgi:thymidylate synthase (FAD)